MLVYDGRLNYHYGEVKVSFNENFAYHGGNLLIGVYPTKTQYYYEGPYPFYGTTVANAAMEGYSNDPDNIPASIIDFIPKTTFVYYDEDYCFAPKDLDYDGYSLTSTSVTLDWTPVGSEQEWKIKYTDEEGNETVVDDITEHPYTLTGLQPGTYYESINVGAVCGEDDVNWTEYNYNGFTTPFCESEDQCELHYELRCSEEGWWDWSNYIEVYYMPDDERYLAVAELRLENEMVLKGDLPLCDGGTYDFIWNVGYSEALEYISFVITDSYGNPIQGLDFSNGGAPEENTTLLENYVMHCPSCKQPSDFSVATASTSASFAWTADNGQDAWELQYSTDETQWSATQNVTGASTCTIDALQPATEYFARVRANCGGGDYSPWTVISFYTDCASMMIDAINPYLEDFDSYEPWNSYGGGGEWKGSRMEVSGKLPLCWNSWNNSDDYQQSMYPYVDYDDESESNVLHFYVYNSEGEGAMLDQYAILPAMEDVAGLMMSFRAKDAESATSNFSVGVMTDPADVATFVEIQTFEADENWSDFTVYFAAYQGQGEYMAIKVVTPGERESYDLYIDGVEVAVMPTCFTPSGFGTSSVGENEATLNWAPYGDETAWQVRYSTDQSNWTVVDCTEQDHGETVEMQIPGLNPNTLYFVQVRANCGDEDYSRWSGLKQFRTECGEYQAVPYYEDFESYSYDQDQPSCWSRINTTNSDYFPNITRYEYQIFYDDDTPNSASYRFYISNSSSIGSVLYAILPKMQDLKTLQMRFDAKGNDNNYWKTYSSRFQVGVMTDPEDESTFTVILDEQENFHSELRSYTVSFADYLGSEGHIAIKVVKESGNDSWLVIDNIFVSQYVNQYIEHYTDDDNGWYLIASPVVGSTSPSMVGNMTTESFDLYAFDQNADGVEWRNYKADEDNFMLENGQGYLYANSNDVMLNFAGAMQTNASVEVPLVYVEGKPFAGWNLVGNPFNCRATLMGNPDYYRVSGNVLVPSSGVLEACEGVFVQATAAGQSITFVRSEALVAEPDAEASLGIGLYQDGKSRCVDMARIRFDEGTNLGKLDILSEPNKLYFTVDGVDYSVIHLSTNGDQSVNFKPAENGCFVLAFDLKDAEMSYLHLIDNITGADVDLLETPTYTFNAKSTDYESRFKLVFAANGEADGNDDFAFFSNGNWVVVNEGEAVVQVIDMNGRILSSETINGSTQVKVNAACGLYVMRLVNGEKVKTQKIVVQ